MDGRTDEKESHCVGCHCFCAVCVDCTTAPTLHTHRPSSQCSVDCMTAILSSPPPSPHTPPHTTHPHTPTHRHRSASQSCVDCMTVWPVCVQRSAVSTFRRRHGSESRGLLRLFLGTPAPTQNHLACVCVQRPAVSTFRRHHG